jgi:hypothetical protein
LGHDLPLYCFVLLLFLVLPVTAEGTDEADTVADQLAPVTQLLAANFKLGHFASQQLQAVSQAEKIVLGPYF